MIQWSSRLLLGDSPMAKDLHRVMILIGGLGEEVVQRILDQEGI